MFNYKKARNRSLISPIIGQLIFVNEAGIIDPISKLVVYKNMYGVLLQWKWKEIYLHKFYTFDLCEFILDTGDLIYD